MARVRAFAAPATEVTPTAAVEVAAPATSMGAWPLPIPDAPEDVVVEDVAPAPVATPAPKRAAPGRKAAPVVAEVSTTPNSVITDVLVSDLIGAAQDLEKAESRDGLATLLDIVELRITILRNMM